LFATTVRDGCLADDTPPPTTVFIVLSNIIWRSSSCYHLSKTQDLDHAVWHLFVLMGSLFHWLGVYYYVVPFNDNNNAGGDELLEMMVQNATVCTAAS
jgi:hypothetical protein